MSIIYKKHDLHPESILIRDFIGEVSVNEIMESWQYLIERKMITDRIKGVINNLSNCNLIMDMEGFKTLMAYIKKQKNLKGIKLAVITETPRTIIFPVIGEFSEKELKIKPFSTMAAAVDWILLDI